MIESLFVTLPPVLFLVVLFGGGALLQRRNIDMDGEPPVSRGVFLSSKYLIVVAWIAVVARSWGVNLSFPDATGPVRMISLGLWASGFALLFAGRFCMGDSFRIGTPMEHTCLKIRGLFRFSRNPMYVGVYTTLAASVLYTLNPIVLGIGVLVIAVHHRIVLAEERHLQKEFGPDYREYSSRVRRYI